MENAYLTLGDERNWKTEHSVDDIQEKRKTNSEDILFFKSRIEIDGFLYPSQDKQHRDSGVADALLGIRLVKTPHAPVELQMSIGGQRVCTLNFGHLGRVCYPLYDKTFLPIFALDFHAVHWQSNHAATFEFIFASFSPKAKATFGTDLYMANAEWWHDPTRDLPRVYFENGECKTHTPKGHEMKDLAPFVREMRRRCKENKL